MAQAIKLTELGLEKNKIILDPGIGFGKTTNHNLEILNNLEIFSSLGFNTLLGASRKRLFSEISKENNPEDRISGTCATSALGVVAGINIFYYFFDYSTVIKLNHSKFFPNLSRLSAIKINLILTISYVILKSIALERPLLVGDVVILAII